MPGELSFSLRLTSAVNITVCRANLGSLEIAREVSALTNTAGNDSNLITIRDPISTASDLDGLLPSQEVDGEDNEPSKDNERSYVKQVLLSLFESIYV